MKRLLLPLLGGAMLLSARAGPAIPFVGQPDPSVEPIHEAYNDLMTNYVDRPDGAALLEAGYAGAVKVLANAGIQDSSLRAPSLQRGRSDNWDQFETAYGHITSKYASKVHSDKLESGVINQMAASLNDCETNYLDPASAQQQRSQQGFGGIGVILKDVPGHPTVQRVLTGPAQKAGLKAGDEIVAIDGKNVDGEPFAVLRDKVRGPQGSAVNITVHRLGVQEDLSFQIDRGQVQAPILEAAMIGSSTGYIHIYSFPPSMLQQLDQALNVFDQRNARAVVLDLRSNTGGDQQTIVSAASRFIQGVPVEIQVERNGSRTTFPSDPSLYWKNPKPLAILADEDTKSGGEVFVKALQEAGAGPVIGTPTLGCVSSARPFQLSDGSLLNVSVAKVLSGQGAEINHAGVKPDVPVGYPLPALAAGNDPQLLAAFQKLQAESVVLGTPASDGGAAAASSAPKPSSGPKIVK